MTKVIFGEMDLLKNGEYDFVYRKHGNFTVDVVFKR